MKLRDITTTITSILESVDVETGELNDTLADRLNNLELSKTEKINHIARYNKSLDMYIEASKREISQMQANKKRLEAIKASLAYVIASSVEDGEVVRDAKTNKVIVSWRKSTSVDITDAEVLHKYFPEVRKEIISTDKTKLKALLQSSEIKILGAELVEKNNIQIH